MLDIIVSVLTAIAGIWLGSFEVRLRSMSDKISEKPNRREVTKEIEVHQESIKVLQTELKEDLRRVETKLDRLLVQKPQS